ncbi:formate-dependent uric acid utilization protein AegA [Shewanella avicenniae]|uniref:Formate-dependent uric acid utilization protein AegA n=2 Tax=Shewanella avicenniae TaxID=2814294 RepID=A0ABX7QPN3_9GAMM|nr:formate-dependent uric acid utilization protein AegA [Shewanella avicenniae]
MNQFVVASARDCLGCRACEVACVLSHNNGVYPPTSALFRPRINVIKAQPYNAVAACHHCENAPCLASCPVAAIEQKDGVVSLSEERCIGCRNCVLACPFGAIEMAEGTQSHQTLAQKCDLCHDTDQGPACVAACPTKSLTLQTDASLAQARRTKQLNTVGGKVSAQAPRFNQLHQLMQRVASQPRQEALKTALAERKTSFVETYKTFSSAQAVSQAARCIKCSDHPVCEWTCPVHNQIPEWVALAKQGKIIEAAELSNSTSSLPEICGRVCPQDRLCEGSCTLKQEYGAVTIGNIERYINDMAFAQGWKPQIAEVTPTGKRVAIIGSGPAGLGCADVLARHGVQPVVFERQPEIGGMLTFGIPSFKLEKQLMIHRRELFTDMGIEFRLNTEIGRDISLHQLLDEFDAVFVGAGTYQSMKAGLEHEDAPGVYEALPYLTANTKQLMGLAEQADEPYINLANKRVVVLGGGDTAMDCLRTALRQNAASVTCAYRRDEANMPGSVKEVKNAREEGAEFLFNVQPTAIQLDNEGQLAAVQFVRTELGEPDASGRRRPQVMAGSEFSLEADALIIAFGFSAHSMPWLADAGVQLNGWGLIEAEATSEFAYQTSHPKIFAGGDIVRGADLVVTAMADGRRAAEGIVASLGL